MNWTVLPQGDDQYEYIKMIRYNSLFCEWKSIDCKSQLPVLIRIFPKDKRTETALTKMLHFHKFIEHQSIEKILNVFEDEKSNYFVWEFKPSLSLIEYVQQNGVCSEDSARNIIIRIIEIYHFLEQHMSADECVLSMHNIMIDETYEISISNCFIDPEESDYPYMLPPEKVAQTKLSYNKASTWCIGVILYYLVVGQYPFGGDSRESILKDILTQSIMIPNYFSETLKDLLNKIFKKNTETRISLDDILNHNWIMNANIPMHVCSWEPKPRKIVKKDRKRSYSQHISSSISIQTSEKNIVFSPLNIKNIKPSSSAVRITPQKKQTGFFNYLKAPSELPLD